MKNNFKILTAFFLLAVGVNYAQTGVGTTTPDASAVLDVSSTSKGFLAPRHSTASRDVIASPANGLIIYNTTTNQLQTNIGTPAAPSWSSGGSSVTASNGLTATGSNVVLGGTLTAATTVAQGSNNLTFSGTGRTIVGGSFQTQGTLYAKAPRVHPIASSITWQADDVVILLQSTHSGSIVFPSASANPNRLVGINNRSGAARSITNVTGGDTGIYADEALSAIASNSGVSWFVSDGTSWRLYSGRP